MGFKIYSVKPGLHIVLTIAEHAFYFALKRILRLLIHRLQIFLVKYEYPPSLQACEHQGIPGKLKKTCLQPCACDPYDLYGDQASRQGQKVQHEQRVRILK